MEVYAPEGPDQKQSWFIMFMELMKLNVLGPSPFSLAPKMKVESSQQRCEFSSEISAHGPAGTWEALYSFHFLFGQSEDCFPCHFPSYYMLFGLVILSPAYLGSSWIWERKIYNLCIFIIEKERKERIRLLQIWNLSILILHLVRR